MEDHLNNEGVEGEISTGGTFTDGKELFDLLEKIREEQGLSIQHICNETGLARSSYCRYSYEMPKIRRVEAKVSFLVKYASVLGVRIALIDPNQELEEDGAL
jgi:transcriptional regulator with XRE-family HTH domain